MIRPFIPQREGYVKRLCRKAQHRAHLKRLRRIEPIFDRIIKQMDERFKAMGVNPLNRDIEE